MSLLREIQAAVDGDISLAVVLRKCMILASRLAHEPFKRWVDQELNGYPEDAELPEYRRIDGLTSIGTFAGPMGRLLKNVPLPMAPLPRDVRDKYLTAAIRDGAAEIEHFAREGEGHLVSRWSPDLTARVANEYYKGYTLVDAYIEIPRNAFVAAADSIRNRVLKFALEIEEQNAEAGDVPPGTRQPLSPDRVGQIFNTYIMGSAQNVAVGSPSTRQHAQQLQIGDLESLTQFLANQGVLATDIAVLEAAVKEDPRPTPGQPFGRRVAAWIGTMVSRAASGAWNIGTSAAADILTAALKAYYGLP